VKSTLKKNQCSVIETRYNCVWLVFWDEEGTKKELCPPISHESLEIIGQPICLADIFEALFIIGIEYSKLDFYTVEIVHKYKRNKDNILDQSDEFCEFLWELIK